MPRASRLATSFDTTCSYGRGRHRNKPVAFVRYESEDESEDKFERNKISTHRQPCIRIVPSAGNEVMKCRVITEIVSSNKKKRSRRLEFNEEVEVDFQALTLSIDIEPPIHSDIEFFTGPDTDADNTDVSFAYLSDGDDGDCSGDGNVFTPVGLGSDNNDDDVSEPLAVRLFTHFT